MNTHLRQVIEEVDLLTVNEVAELLRVDIKTVYKRKEEIPGFIRGLPFIRFSKKVFMQYLDDRAFKPKPALAFKSGHQTDSSDRHGLLV